MAAERTAALKQKLASLRYDQPLGVESAPLVERLLEDLTKSNKHHKELEELAEARAAELLTMEQQAIRRAGPPAPLFLHPRSSCSTPPPTTLRGVPCHPHSRFAGAPDPHGERAPRPREQ